MDQRSNANEHTRPAREARTYIPIIRSILARRSKHVVLGYDTYDPSLWVWMRVEVRGDDFGLKTVFLDLPGGDGRVSFEDGHRCCVPSPGLYDG